MPLLAPSSPSLKKLLASATTEYEAQGREDPRFRAYLEERGLLHGSDVLRLGVVRSPLKGHDRYAGRLAIPSIGPSGGVYDIRYRCLEHAEEGHDSGCPKYLGSDGVRTRPYNTRALVSPTDYLFITEGELDAATLTVCGWPAMGIPGASAWKPHYVRMVANFSQVVVIGDGDTAGRRFATDVSRAITDARMVVMPEGTDVNSCFTSEQGRQYSNNGSKGYLASLLREEDDE